jgi:parvulin-like peptidyl-prolyl isomerase
MYRVPVLILIALLATSICWTQQSSTTAAGATAVTTSTSSNSNLAPDQRVVMKVGDTQITQKQFEEMYGDFLKDQGGAPVPKKKTTAENFAGGLMLAKEAEATGLNKKPEVQRDLEMNRIQVLSNAEYTLLQDKAKPSMQEISAYYDSHLDDFDEVTIRRVFIYKQLDHTNGHGLPAAEAQARADQIRKVLASGGDAKALIAGTKDAIDVDPLTFRRDDLPEIMKNAFNMKIGEWSQVADTTDALILFEVVNKGRLNLKTATPEIDRKVQAQKLREEMDALKKKSGVWLDDEYFAGPVSAAQSPVPSPSDEKRAQQK